MMKRLRKHIWTYWTERYLQTKHEHWQWCLFCICTHGYRGISPNKTPSPNRYSSLATLSTQQNQKKAKYERQGRTMSGKMQRELSKDVSVGGRRFGKQINNKQERGVDATGSRRCGSITKETQGRTEGRRYSGRTSAKVLDCVLALTRPWSAGRKRRRGRVVLIREPTAPQPGSNHGEQRAHFPFVDVTGEHGG